MKRHARHQKTDRSRSRSSRKRREPRSPEEARLAAAEKRGRAKARMVKDAGQLLLATLIVSIFSVRAAGWVFMIGGLFWLGDVFKRVVEPQLRERWIEREVRKELHHEVAAHRQVLEGEHARHIEHLAAGVAHEIRNPITAAKSLVQQMGEDPGSNENVEYAEVALEELGRVERSISHLLRFAREEGLSAQPVELREVVRSALESFRERIDRESIEIRTRLDGPAALEGDPEKLRRAVINLITNALDAMRDAGVRRPALEIDAGEDLAGTAVWLRLRDHGPGIDEQRRQEIWSPFFTSKDEGTGLGLAITKKIIDAHGGTIEVEPAASGGAVFTLTLPKHQPRSEGLS
ncbi:MAG: hypothetical protein CL910_01985 [Deltaproteobacteria bacterium]|jgi:signal transduction histidine kinase|nr:hypothetical protein [Deltaproteobacteria bacterium]